MKKLLLSLFCLAVVPFIYTMNDPSEGKVQKEPKNKLTGGFKLFNILKIKSPRRLKTEIDINSENIIKKYGADKYEDTIQRKKETIQKRIRMSEALVSEIMSAERIHFKKKKARETITAFVNALISGNEIEFDREMLKKYDLISNENEVRQEKILKAWFKSLQPRTKSMIKGIIDTKLYRTQCTLIHMHARKCRVQAILNLIAVSANPHWKDIHGHNAFHYLANSIKNPDIDHTGIIGNIEASEVAENDAMVDTMMALVGASVKINEKDNAGNTPLDFAIFRKKDSLVESMPIFGATQGSGRVAEFNKNNKN